MYRKDTSILSDIKQYNTFFNSISISGIVLSTGTNPIQRVANRRKIYGLLKYSIHLIIRIDSEMSYAYCQLFTKNQEY